MSNRAGDQEAIESTNNRNLERRLTLRRFRLAAAGVSDVAHVKTFSAEWMGLIFLVWPPEFRGNRTKNRDREFSEQLGQRKKKSWESDFDCEF